MTFTYRGKTALITGASAGLGAEFARRLAARGSDLVLVARRADRLTGLADELRAAHGVAVEVVPFDLARPGAGRALHAEVTARGLDVRIVVNSAGFGTHGAFAAEDPDRVAEEITLNVAALVDVTRAFLPGLLAGADAAGGSPGGSGGGSASTRGGRAGDRGAVVNIASTAGYQPTPGMAVYGATKAFVLNFTEALAHELRDAPVRVLAVSPGPTRTEFFDVVGTEVTAVGRMQTAEQVVTTALAALDRRTRPPSVVSGLANRLTALGPRLLPRRTVLAVSGRLLRA